MRRGRSRYPARAHRGKGSPRRRGHRIRRPMRILPRLLGSSGLALAAALAAGAAAAEETKPAAAVAASGPASPADPNAWETAPPTRRSGFALGVAIGFGVASVVGFPN